MHRLARGVRFSINPFLSEESEGANPYASKPAGEGLTLYLELSVEVVGDIEPATGFIVNVSDIDRDVRKFAVPVFVERIRKNFRNAGHITLTMITELLGSAWDRLSDKFGTARLSRLTLKLNPSRTVSIESKDFDMFYFCEKFEFAATHTLWNENFSEEKNLEIFGKCANPTGHGHNYIIEVTVKVPNGVNDFSICDFEKIVDEELIKIVDHKNLNLDVAHFRQANPTVENITSFAWKKLAGKFGRASLHGVTVWENDRTCCSYYGGKS
jgi:6-pyruvoyltetrahydropterin/6-carboxytetrahydropterin synthase